MLKIIVGILLAATSSILFANEEPQMTQQERNEAFMGLDWKEEGTYKLPNSNSTLIVPNDRIALIGKDSERAGILMGESSNDAIEALTYKVNLDDLVIFENYSEGYVAIDDWEEVNPSELLASIRENTEKGNAERVRQGFEEVHVVGWMQEPTLDRKTNTVYMAIEGSSESGSIVNSVALRLGRKGYEKIIWVTDKDAYIPYGGELEVMLLAHSFDPGFQYKDYIPGDKVAGYGIAALVAATAGGKILKATGLFVLFKKAGGFIIAAIAALFYKFKSFLKRNKDVLE